MKVLFDTSSGHVLLAHRACKSPACTEHRRYSPWESSTAQDVDADGDAVQAGARLVKGPVNRTVVSVEFTQADLGEGQAKGILVRDNVCLGAGAKGSRACANVAVLAALQEDDAPFRAMPHDGIVGLGFESLSSGPLSSFYGRLLDSSHGLLPHFSLHLGPHGGELVFGGHDPARLSGPIQWLPVFQPEDGFWQVRIAAVRVGNVTVDACERGCRGVIDTGSASLGVPKAQLGDLLRSLSSTRSAEGACEGPTLQLDLGGPSLELLADDYTGTSCQPELGALDMGKEFAGVYALGTTALHRHYTAFDWAEGRVGFAGLAPQPAAVQRASATQLTGVIVV
jgi:cathepsin D